MRPSLGATDPRGEEPLGCRRCAASRGCVRSQAGVACACHGDRGRSGRDVTHRACGIGRPVGTGSPELPSRGQEVDKSHLAHPEPRRFRDKEHVKFVANQPWFVAADPQMPITCGSRSTGHSGAR